MPNWTDTELQLRRQKIFSLLTALATARQTTPKGEGDAYALYTERIAESSYSLEAIDTAIRKLVYAPRGEYETNFPPLADMLEAIRQQDLAERVEIRRQEDRQNQQQQRQGPSGDSLGGLVVTASQWREWKENHPPEEARKWENLPAYIMLGTDDCRECGGLHFVVRTKTGKKPWAKGMPREESVNTHTLPCPVCRKAKYDALVIEHRIH